MSADSFLPLLLRKPTILLLGGTGEARDLAAWLATRPARVITSLAGRTQKPHHLPGEWRSGGFGGIDGLIAFLHHEQIDLIIDVTHPFAQKISANAHVAARQTATPLVRYERPAWQKTPQDNWIEVDDERQAAAILPTNSRVFLALGRQHLAPFAHRCDVQFIARMIEADEMRKAFPNFEIMAAPPADEDAEKHLLSRLRIDMLVSRNSGGTAAYGKIAAARALSLPVILIRRPQPTATRIFTSLQQIKKILLATFPSLCLTKQAEDLRET